MVCCGTLLWVGICHMAWQLNGFLILDKNEAQSFCKEFAFLDGSFPSNSCASKLSYSICNLWTQYTNIYKWAEPQITWAISRLQSLWSFKQYYECAAVNKLQPMSLSHQTQQAAGKSYLAAGHVEPTTNPWERKNTRERNQLHSKAHRLNPYAFLSASNHTSADDTQIYSSSLDLAYGPLIVQGYPPGTGLKTSQTWIQSQLVLPEWPWVTPLADSRWHPLINSPQILVA